MKSKEREMLNIINSRYDDADFQEAADIYSRWDAEDVNTIVELKHRETLYDEWLIEFDKYSFNFQYSLLNNKQFFYISGTDKCIDIFNMRDLHNKGINYNWKWMDQPRTTEFNKKELIKKYVGFIPRKYA